MIEHGRERNEAMVKDGSGLVTRPESPPDVDDIRAVNIAAFETSEEADLVDALRGSSAWIDGLSWVATTAAGDVVGHALLTRCTVGESAGLCLAPCAVDPRYQGQGIGSAVIEAALEAARVQGGDLVVVLGHPGYYPRFGFRRASDYGIGLSIDVPADALMVMTLNDDASVPAGTVCYAEPFGIPC